jgi:hypothetical protein
MTVSDVLDRAGWPAGQHGRTTCPVHRGTNKTAFQYGGNGWHCHGCGAGGTAWALAQTLGVLPERVGKRFVIGGLEALNQAGSGYAPTFPTSALTLLRNEAQRRRESRLDQLTGELAYASFLIRSGGELYRLVMERFDGPLGSSFTALDAAADAVWAGLALEEAVNRVTNV